MKNRLIYWFVTAAVCTCLATAQNSQVHSSAAKTSPDPLKSATKPLTQKSATTPHRSSSSVPAPKPAGTSKPSTTGNTSSELTRLERQNVTAKGSKTASTSAPRPPLWIEAG